MLRNITTHFLTVDEFTMTEFKIKLVLTWKGRGPRVPGCGERFPGLRGAGAGPTGALASAAEIVPAGTWPPL